ncbi:hypothetical protein AVV29_gp021 [Vibrio phage phi 3]|uniref:Uncharacterized protein n=1 Tax=Vibrio phage phi 3 TaxID=1589298 RepID=A0A0B5HAM3_9CAUD|nr:hypothetical protein AVV29_gp021 [Vibrio phage phi 3]AJF40789.1 hypothetical protein SBVP3_0021 [Vibrio phage phi 3]
MGFLLYFMLMAIPGLIALVLAKLVWKEKVTDPEFTLGGAFASVLAALACVGIYVGMHSNMWDTEVWNGKVTSKYSKKVSCSHKYKCGETCTSDSKGNKTCVPIYCDEHPWDISWFVESTVGSVKIDRVDRRGLKEPPRFTKVEIGEYFARENNYKNYLKANKDSLFYKNREAAENYKGIIPAYPRVYDYYRNSKVFNFSKVSTQDAETLILEWLKEYGGTKQVNIIAVFTEEGTEYFDMLQARWGGVKKNDVLLMYGMSGNKVAWFRSTSFADGMNNRELHVHLRNAAIEKEWSTEILKEQLALVLEKFSRIPNSDFADMAENIKPSFSMLVWFFVICFFLNVAFVHYLVTNQDTNIKPVYKYPLGNRRYK